jgi:hypothetical protein
MIATAITLSVLTAPLAAVALTLGQSVRISPVGHTVAEFSAATAPGNPQLMVASAMDNDIAGGIRCAVYVSRDGGSSWSEVPAWPSPPLKFAGDPSVAIGADGTIHAACITRTTAGARAIYTQSRDQGVTWSPVSIVTPLPGQFHRQSADKSLLAVDAAGTVYIAFSQVITSPIGTRALVVARSPDNGKTWKTRNTGADGGFCTGLVATATSVTAVFLRSDLSYATVTSTDGGDTWSAAAVLGEINGSNLPSIARDSLGRTVIAAIAGGALAPRLEISIEDDTGALVQQFQLPFPTSSTAQSGRKIQPAITAAPTGLPAVQLACKVDATTSTSGQQEVWLHTSVDQPATTPLPILVNSTVLPAGMPTHDDFAGRFPDGGDYWSLTWRSDGWQSMWVDPRTGGGPGELFTAPVTN